MCSHQDRKRTRYSPPRTSLLSLCLDALILLFQYADSCDHVHLQQTCRQLREMGNDPTSWVVVDIRKNIHSRMFWKFWSSKKYVTTMRIHHCGCFYMPPSYMVKSLTHLEARACVLARLDRLGGLRSLTSLDLHGNPFIDIRPLANATSLTFLDLGDTAACDLRPLAGLTALTDLNLENTPVSDVTDLAGLTSLRKLVLYGTYISDVSPLAGLTSLTYLDVAKTGVSNVRPLAGLRSLQTLCLGPHRVMDLSPLAALTQLTVHGAIHREANAGDRDELPVDVELPDVILRQIGT